MLVSADGSRGVAATRPRNVRAACVRDAHEFHEQRDADGQIVDAAQVNVARRAAKRVVAFPGPDALAVREAPEPAFVELGRHHGQRRNGS